MDRFAPELIHFAPGMGQNGLKILLHIFVMPCIRVQEYFSIVFTKDGQRFAATSNWNSIVKKSVRVSVLPCFPLQHLQGRAGKLGIFEAAFRSDISLRYEDTRAPNFAHILRYTCCMH